MLTFVFALMLLVTVCSVKRVKVVCNAMLLCDSTKREADFAQDFVNELIHMPNLHIQIIQHDTAQHYKAQCVRTFHTIK